ncbi:MAG: amidohydrolase family protein, partial [Planctomycetota bacterium]|nr:amidohydrolase family protein [Planctomycetota bacterium]
RDAAGKPDGGVFGEAQGMIYSVIREDQSIARRRELLRSAMAHANGLGVTQIGALETQLGLHDLLIPMAREDLLTLRIDATISSAATRVDQWRPTLLWAAANREPGPGLRIIGFKGYMDGSLGSRNAWQTEPYLDDPGNPENTGNPRTMAVTGALPELIALGASMGLQPAVHAIGDQANHLLLDWYGDLPEAQRRALRPRIEHAQHLLPEDVSRFGALGVIPSMQPWHKADDGRYAEQRLGPERVKTSYAFRGLLDSGAALAFGSDWPVVTVNPFLGMHAAVNATTLDGAVFVPEQSISIEEALHAYTRAAAFCLHSEAQTGAIREGFEASFVILDRDLLAIDPSEIGEVRPVLTCVRGEVVFESDDR